MKKKVTQALLAITLSVQVLDSYACTVCRSQQPKALEGIAHGVGPENNWDYVIIVFATVIVLYTLVASIRLIIRPGEQDPGHIKTLILTDHMNERTP